MAKIGEIVRYLDDLLRVSTFKDFTFDGLVVEGCEEVTKVGCAVDACLESFEELQDCQLIVTHHGMWWPSVERLVGRDKRLIASLMKRDINLYSSHLPLDAHPQFGNNAQILQKMGLSIGEVFGECGWTSELKEPVDLEELEERFSKLVNGEARAWNFGKKRVSKVAVVSGGGGGSNFLQEAEASGVDLYITGDGSHTNYHLVKELGLNVIYGGHYRTEVFGVQALMPQLEELFGVSTRFHECPSGM